MVKIIKNNLKDESKCEREEIKFTNPMYEKLEA